MKQSLIFIAITALLMAGCHRKSATEISTHTLSGEQCYEVIFDKEKAPWGTDFGVKVNYSLTWPDKGELSPEAERELMILCFVDSTSTDVKTAIEKWMATPFSDEEDYDCEKKAVKSIDESGDFSHMTLESTYTEDSVLGIFVINSSCSVFGAAHGMYGVDYLTIDKKSRKVIHLSDLVTDTQLLREAIGIAIQDLDVNNEVRECLFGEFRDVEPLPLPTNFVIDSARNHITVFYGLYEIAPYACGIQEVTLPIFWLSKHVPLTPYAKELFGPDSSL